MWKIARSLGDGRTPEQSQLTKEYLAACRAAGIEEIEVSPEQAHFDTLDYEAIARAAKEAGVGLWSFHLCFWPFALLDPSALEEEKRLYTVAYFEGLIAKAAAIGIRHFIIHPSGEPIPDAERPARMAQAKKSLFALAEYAKKLDGVICVEDLPRTCLGRDSSEVLDLISVHPDLRVVFDTNHLLTEDPADFVRAVGDKIVSLHVSDYDNKNERHWLPGEGVIDWTALRDALAAVGYKGPWLYEVGDECPATIRRARDLCPADFARNAREIFAGKPLTVLSTPVEGLKRWDE